MTSLAKTFCLVSLFRTDSSHIHTSRRAHTPAAQHMDLRRGTSASRYGSGAAAAADQAGFSCSCATGEKKSVSANEREGVWEQEREREGKKNY